MTPFPEFFTWADVLKFTKASLLKRRERIDFVGRNILSIHYGFPKPIEQIFLNIYYSLVCRIFTVKKKKSSKVKKKLSCLLTAEVPKRSQMCEASFFIMYEYIYICFNSLLILGFLRYLKTFQFHC